MIMTNPNANWSLVAVIVIALLLTSLQSPLLQPWPLRKVAVLVLKPPIKLHLRRLVLLLQLDHISGVKFLVLIPFHPR